MIRITILLFAVFSLTRAATAQTCNNQCLVTLTGKAPAWDARRQCCTTSMMAGTSTAGDKCVTPRATCQVGRLTRVGTTCSCPQSGSMAGRVSR